MAEGVATGPKSSTTIAYTRIDKLDTHRQAALLGAAWLARWRRSHSQFPAGLPESEREAFARQIESHPQFAGVSAER
ncbi:MAG: hypothetical protein NVV63_04175 [Opitutus sp.]|nr:hypothetical protein [Opitutus sp.]